MNVEKEAELYKDLLSIKIKLSNLLKNNFDDNYCKISLEDIFTILDKTINNKTIFFHIII